MSWMTLSLTHAASATTLDLVDGDNFNLKKWSPTLSRERKDILAGRSKYEDVPEQIEIGLFGTNVLSNFETLSWLLDKAGKENEIVTLRVQLQNSLLASPLECQVLGSGRSPLKTSATFNDLLMVHEIPNIVIDIKRQGLLLGAEDSVVVSAVSQPAIMIATMAEELRIPGPTKITLVTPSQIYVPNYGYAVVSDYHTDKIELLDASALSVSSGFTSVDESANNSYLGNAMRTQSGGRIYKSYGASPLTGFDSCAILVAVRNAGASGASYQMHVEAAGYGDTVVSRVLEIDDTTTEPRILSFGILHQSAGKWARFDFVVSQRDGVGTDYFYVDYVALVPFGPNTQIVNMFGDRSSNLATYNDIVFDHRALTNERAIAYTGDVYRSLHARSHAYIETSGEKVAVLVMSGDNEDWRMMVTNDSAVATLGLKVDRHKAYLVPQ